MTETEGQISVVPDRPPSDVPLLQAIDVVKEFRGPRQGRFGFGHAFVQAVSWLYLTLDVAETLGGVGEAGAGVSTLGRVLMRLMTPTSGQVLLDGHDAAELEKKDK